jgi:hypothetical protein
MFCAQGRLPSIKKGESKVDLDAFARTIQFILAPVVMITSCAVLLNGLLARYAAVNDRLRTMDHERFDLLVRSVALGSSEANHEKALVDERLDEIDTQLPILLRRHQVLRDGLLALYGAILVFVAAMFAIATVVIASLPAVTYGALVLFLLGNALLLFSVLLIVIEVRMSHRALRYEVGRLLRLRQRERPAADMTAKPIGES